MNQELTSTDPSVLAVDELLERCMGNIEFAERVLSKFLDRFDEDLDELERGVESENSEEIARVAHRLKGASANVGAPGLRDRAAAVESLARAQPGCGSKSSCEIRSGLKQLRNEWSRFIETCNIGG